MGKRKGDRLVATAQNMGLKDQEGRFQVRGQPRVPGKRHKLNGREEMKPGIFFSMTS